MNLSTKSPYLTIFLLLLILFNSCDLSTSSTHSRPQEIPSPQTVQKQASKLIEKIRPVEKLDTAQHLQNYVNLKAEIKRDRSIAQTNRHNVDQAKDYLFEILTDSIFPYWYGTTWDFNGITQTPRKGDIACGYFVTTTLRDAGIKLQRYKLAQQGAADIAKKLCAPNSIKWFNDVESLSSHLTNKGNDQIYVIGLDYHVGFVVRENGENFFVHSNYINRSGVIREKLEDSRAIGASNAYVIGNLLENKTLLETWLKY